MPMNIFFITQLNTETINIKYKKTFTEYLLQKTISKEILMQK